MTALRSLIEDHRFIASLTGALEVYARCLAAGLEAEPAHLRGFAAVLTEFGDNLHHEKEERVLLPFLSRHGFDWNAPPLALIREEHRQELYRRGPRLGPGWVGPLGPVSASRPLGKGRPWPPAAAALAIGGRAV